MPEKYKNYDMEAFRSGYILVDPDSFQILYEEYSSFLKGQLPMGEESNKAYNFMLNDSYTMEAKIDSPDDKYIPISIYWENVSKLSVGKFIYFKDTPQKGKISLSVKPPNVGCSGYWQYLSGKYNTSEKPHGTWHLLCEDGLTAKGTYSANNPLNGVGEGLDANGNEVKFVFGNVQ